MLSNIQYCFEGRHAQRCWIGVIFPCQLTFEATEKFVKTVRQYSEAGLRNIHLTIFKSTRDTQVVHQEKHTYSDAPVLESTLCLHGVKDLGLIKFENLDTGQTWDVFIPAFPIIPGDGGTVERYWQKKKIRPIQDTIINVLVSAFSELTEWRIGCSWSKCLHSQQKWNVIKMGRHEFPTDIPCDSPIEEMFWKHAQKEMPLLVSQYQIDSYRVDFALPEEHVVIELDGHAYHKTQEQRTYDARRERHLQELGWRVIRFTGQEIQQNVMACLEDVKCIVKNDSMKEGES